MYTVLLKYIGTNIKESVYLHTFKLLNISDIVTKYKQPDDVDFFSHCKFFSFHPSGKPQQGTCIMWRVAFLHYVMSSHHLQISLSLLLMATHFCTVKNFYVIKLAQGSYI